MPNYPSNAELYNQASQLNDRGDIFSRMPAKSASMFLKPAVDQLNPYKNPLSTFMMSSMLFRRASMMSSMSYGFSLQHGTGLLGLGRGAPIGFKTLGAGTKRGGFLGGTMGFGLGALIGGGIASRNEATPLGTAAAALGGGIAGKWLLSPYKGFSGGVAGLAGLIPGVKPATVTKIQNAVRGTQGFLFGGVGQSGFVRAPMFGPRSGYNRLGMQTTASKIAMTAPYTGTGLPSLDAIMGQNLLTPKQFLRQAGIRAPVESMTAMNNNLFGRFSPQNYRTLVTAGSNYIKQMATAAGGFSELVGKGLNKNMAGFMKSFRQTFGMGWEDAFPELNKGFLKSVPNMRRNVTTEISEAGAGGAVGAEGRLKRIRSRILRKEAQRTKWMGVQKSLKPTAPIVENVEGVARFTSGSIKDPIYYSKLRRRITKLDVDLGALKAQRAVYGKNAAQLARAAKLPVFERIGEDVFMPALYTLGGVQNAVSMLSNEWLRKSPLHIGRLFSAKTTARIESQLANIRIGGYSDAETIFKTPTTGSAAATNRAEATARKYLRGGKSSTTAKSLRAGGVLEKGLKGQITNTTNAALRIQAQAGMAMIAKISWFTMIAGLAAQGAGAIGKGIVKGASQIAEGLGRISRTEFGSGKAFESMQATTERQRAIQAISNAGLNARTYLGREAAILSQ